MNVNAKQGNEKEKEYERETHILREPEAILPSHPQSQPQSYHQLRQQILLLGSNRVLVCLLSPLWLPSTRLSILVEVEVGMEVDLRQDSSPVLSSQDLSSLLLTDPHLDSFPVPSSEDPSSLLFLTTIIEDLHLGSFPALSWEEPSSLLFLILDLHLGSFPVLSSGEGITSHSSSHPQPRLWRDLTLTKVQVRVLGTSQIMDPLYLPSQLKYTPKCQSYHPTS